MDQGRRHKCVDLYKPPKWGLVFFVLVALPIIIVVSILQSKKSSPAELRLDAKTSSGDVTGTARTSSAGRRFVSFEGLPYAQPPVGPLRFKNPQLPPTAWKGVLRAWAPRARCLSLNAHNPLTSAGDEDCLYLNVYTPAMDGSAAVVVWFGSSNFLSQNEDSQAPRPDWIIEKDIVLVTVQYRRGVLGFLSTSDLVAPGNYGLKDQLAALRWVQDNIAAFGGDPARVTIAGFAVGAASVTYHMLSPLSAGLFRSAIAMSGSALNPGTFCQDPYAHTMKFTEIFSSESFHNSSQLVDFLRTEPASELVSKQFMANRDKDFSLDPCSYFVPSAEPTSNAAFLTEPPWRTLETLLPNAVPFLVGAMTIKNVPVSKNMLPSDADDHFIKFVASSLRLPTLEQRRRAAAQVRSFYFGDDAIASDKAEDARNMLEDMLGLEGVDRMARTVATLSPHPVYYYHYTYRKNNSDPLAEHDALRVLYSAGDEHELDPNSEEAIFYDTWLTMLTEFIKTGTPSAAGVSWPPYSVSSPSYLLVEQPMKIARDLLPARMDFWRTLLPPWVRV